MPTLTQYWFQTRFFAGLLDGWNQPHAGWAWISGGSSAATLVWNRQDNARVVSRPRGEVTARKKTDRGIGTEPASTIQQLGKQGFRSALGRPPTLSWAS
jgi:hypothetical protein